MTTIRGDKISAVDLSLVMMLNSKQPKTKKSVLSQEDILWQEQRRQRKVRKLDFEVRWKNFGKFGSTHWEVSVTQKQKIMMIGLLSFAPVYLLVTWSLTFLLYLEYWDTGMMYQVNYMKPKKKGYAKQTATFLKIEDAVFWEEHVKKNLGAMDTTITVH